MIELEFLKEQNVSESLIHGIEEFRKNYNVDEGAAARVTRPSIPFYGKEILEMAIAGLLEGENLLLAGPGKKYPGRKSGICFWPPGL